jgi:hypothetical protein
MMRERKDLAGAAGTSCDIIPFRHCLSREIWVPFWEFRGEEPTACTGAQGGGHPSQVMRASLAPPYALRDHRNVKCANLFPPTVRSFAAYRGT